MKDIDNIHMLLYARSLPPLFFSLKHIAYHAFTHEILNRNKYFSNNVSSAPELSHTRPL